ncbi:dihydrolipoyllysine-residue acetyltransferase [Candidatus Berkiella cookevillensis]|uniref:Dihydrolipoamide acetyltransferase component of pyruvate dehydrogenase complex n=1 Tax=Candidatus Berkiella cookevillensis TaxID=437022 RepID=A0A0Q9YFJ9_9GAMM|nr:dihydrolipoyllysine-residue acetyltransferase [Candidatus Berkiella cookevillensis]MCS5708186.1 dihydrolipoyllysine-residue acetyltransferase [Candidatus Berkiella cookevillensis]
MSALEDIKVPNIGDFHGVEVIELLVKVGDVLAAEDPLLTLETEKATMDIPCPMAGVVDAILVKAGDKVSQGDVILKLKATANETKIEPPASVSTTTAVEQQSLESTTTQAEVSVSVNAPVSSSSVTISLPQADDFKDVTVIEILVKPGDKIVKDQSIIALESEKASLELPSEEAGVIEEIFVKVGDKANPGTKILKMLAEVSGPVATEVAQKTALAAPAEKTSVPATQIIPVINQASPSIASVAYNGTGGHAGPATRKLARVLGVDLSKVSGSGHKGRITTQDVEQYVKAYLQKQPESTGTGIPPIPAQDFSQFGEIEVKSLSRIKKLTARNMSRNWLNIPHVTQFDEADITELEKFRKGNKQAAQDKGINLTPVSFIIKAVVSALKTFPQFNASLSTDSEELIYKKYFNIGVAVDTPNGLLVPVLKDADAKGLFEIAKEIGELSEKARKGELKAAEMQGNTFTITSLGNLGGTQFTPIINAPDVAILGVSRLSTKAVWLNEQFVPRQMLPLALSYDHRVIDGVEGAKFMTHICTKLQDIRKLLL